MKNFKKITAVTMAVTMLLGSSLTVSAAGPTGGDTGSGSYEGYVDETSVFSASIPTNAANVFNFFVDPNGLLEETGYARLAGKTADDFEAGSTLYFTRTPSDTVKEFGKDSEKVTAKNMSSYEVKIEVSASITGIDGITMAESDTIAPEEQNPTLYLAIVHDTDKVAVKANEGGLLSGEIAGTPDNFKIQYNTEKGKYEYAQKAADQLTDWATYDFYLTGACGGTWTDAQAEATPTVELTWKITDPNANEAPSIEKNEYEYIANQTTAIPLNLGAGDLAATGIDSITFVKSGTTQTLATTKYSVSNGKLIFVADYSAAFAGTSREHTIIFNDAAKTKVKLTLVPYVANMAPSIEKTTYKFVAGQSLEVPVNLGRGNLAATGIDSVTFVKSGSSSTLAADKYSLKDGKLIFVADYNSTLVNNGGSRVHTVTFNDAAKTTVTLVLEAAD